MIDPAEVARDDERPKGYVTTGELAVMAGVRVDNIKKWKRRGDLPNAPVGKQGQGSELFWSPVAAQEVLGRASERRGPAYRRPGWRHPAAVRGHLRQSEAQAGGR